ncbi:MAG: flagellin modification protein FlmC [Saprospiraceae bacterium]|nr:MAG: flagellin modification protein FlmC [Saprospiraceae bacterium]
MKTGFLITARLKSSRLPKKLLLEVNGEPIIVWMIRRLKLATILDEIIICTSTNPQDDPLVEIAQKEGIKYYRGSEEDVLVRLFEAKEKFGLDYVISMTADCPLLPFDLIEDVVSTYKKTDADLIKCHHLPIGLYLSGLKTEAMKRLIEIKGSSNTEYWLNYFYKTDLFKVVQLETSPDLEREGYRLALDYPEDWQVFKYIYQQLGPEAYRISTSELINWLDGHKHIFEINRDCNQKGVKRTQEDSTSVVKLKDGTIIK